jgi:hypothetical protein
LSEKPEGRDHPEYEGVDRRIILKWIFKLIGFTESGMDSCGSGQEPVAGSCEHGNGP